MRRILKSYLFWTYPRGSFHYDVIVTLILAFIFLSPRVVNYHDHPQETPTSSRDVVVSTSAANRLTYRIGGDQIQNVGSEPKVRAELLQRIQSISGNVQMDRYSEQKDSSGRVTEYRVWAHR